MLKVAVIGGLGRMGRETIKAVSKESGMEITAIVDRMNIGESLEEAGKTIKIYEKTADVKDICDVFIDFTGPDSVKKNAFEIIAYGKKLIIGATGVLENDIAEIREAAEKSGASVMIIPNFAIGAVLMMQFSKLAAKYMNEAEIIEYHHPGKLDAPSGTAIKTAELIKSVKAERAAMQGKELLEGARGAEIGDINIHSVRLNGYVASQEVIFGGLGQVLTIRHDSINRESFMPGVILSLKKINEIRGLVYGLENIL